MEQIYLGVQVLILGCSVNDWNIYFWDVKAWLLPVVSRNGTDIFGMSMLHLGCSVNGWNRYIWEVKASLWTVVSMDGKDIFGSSRLDWGLLFHWMEQIYLGGQGLIVGCSVKGWNRYIWEVNVWLCALVPMERTDIFGRPRLDYGL